MIKEREKIIPIIPHIVHPIGQGSFVEQLVYYHNKKHRIIYDCGSYNIDVLRKRIKSSIDTNIPTTLVISHLHRDHVNGIPYLLNHFGRNKIEKIYLPLYSCEILYLFALSIITTSTTETIKEDVKLVRFIMGLRNPKKYLELNRVTFITSRLYKEEQSEKIKYITDDKPICIPELDNDKFWNVKFWVDPDIYSILTNDDLEKLRKYPPEFFYEAKNYKELKSFYGKMVKEKHMSLNKTSMLMSSFLFSETEQEEQREGFFCTGDYPLHDLKKVNEIRKHYFVKDNIIQEMMVPHHGGRGYCDRIPFEIGQIKKAYIQYGKGNRYRHPNPDVMKSLNDYGIYPIMVENP